MKMSTALIVGGGMTGLSAGIHLLLPGRESSGGSTPDFNRKSNHGKGRTDTHERVFDRVIICEQHTVAGGNLTGWDRGGCHIDNCVHWLTGTNPHTSTYALWEDLGVLGKDGLPVIQTDSLFSAEAEGQRVTLWYDLDRTVAEMLALSPEDSEEISRFIRAIQTMQHLCGIGGVAHSEKTTSALRPAALSSLARYLRLSTGELAKRFKNPALRRFMTVFGTDQFSSLALITASAHFCGGNGGLPKGGSTAMAQKLTDRFLSLGGILRTGARVVSITQGISADAPSDVPSGSRLPREDGMSAVTLSDGTVIPCDAVIITADPAAVFGRVLDAPMPPALAKAYSGHEYRFSAFHAAFAVRAETLHFAGDLVTAIPPREQVVLDFADRLPPRDKNAQLSDYVCPNVLFREFSHEPSFAPAGETVVQATVFCPASLARLAIRLAQNPERYQAFKAAFAASVRRILLTVSPEAADSLRLLDVWTPATYRRFTGADIGSFMGFTMRPGSVPRHLDGHIPGFENVLLAGQWLSSPGGLPIAAAEGKRAAALAERQYRRSVSSRIRVSFSG